MPADDAKKNLFPNEENFSLPCFSSPVPAGFPSSLENYEEKLDLNHYLVQRPSSTFFCRVEGDSMIDAGIFSQDILIVDKSVEPKNGSIVIALINSEYTLKRLRKRGKHFFLEAENANYPPIAIGGEDECIIWGVVIGSARKYDS